MTVDGTPADLPHTNDTPFRPTREASDALDQHLTESITALSPPAIASPTRAKSMSITGIGGTGGTIKQMLEDNKAKLTDMIDGNLARLKQVFDKQQGAVQAFGRMVDTAQSETDAFLADLGQFTNDLGV